MCGHWAVVGHALSSQTCLRAGVKIRGGRGRPRGKWAMGFLLRVAVCGGANALAPAVAWEPSWHPCIARLIAVGVLAEA